MKQANARNRSPFRLNLEQQKKRAKELLRAVKAGDAQAWRRIESSVRTSAATAATKAPNAKAPNAKAPDAEALDAEALDAKLTDAQRAIARELGFPSWARLKAHIAAMDREQAAIASAAAAVDAELGTLHVRCGSDIRETLKAAGFAGDFLEHAYPYTQGPVSDGPGSCERRAEFLVGTFGSDLQLEYDAVLARCRYEEQRLAGSPREYERIVLWTEHDSYDQLMLIRCLAVFAQVGVPPTLELVATNHFPGDARFLGLGQLPPEALRLLWQQRRPVTRPQIALGAAAWQALTADDPRALAAIMRTRTRELPLLAPALHRHLRELPSIETGLSLTEHLILEMLAEQSASVQAAFRALREEREPLPWLGDLGFAHIVECMMRVEHPVIEKKVGPDTKERDVALPIDWSATLSITDLGRAVLRGDLDWLSLRPPPRWVGGVRIDSASAPSWRWDETHCTATCLDTVAHSP